MLKVLIVQRFLTHYRKELFEFLQQECCDVEITVVHSGECLGISTFKEVCFPAKVFKFNIGKKKYNLFFSKPLIEYIKNNRFDAVILEGTTNLLNNYFICKQLKKNKIPYVWWDAGRRYRSKLTVQRFIASPLIRYLIRGASVCVAYSNIAKGFFIKTGVKKDKVFVAHNTLVISNIDKAIEQINTEDLEIIKKKYRIDNKLVFLYVGEISRRKRVEDLITAFGNIEQKYKDKACLIVIGDGTEKNTLEEYVNNSKIDNVHFTGKIIDEVNKYFHISSVFILPSEGGLALNQAMACSKPVIASSADGTELDLIRDGYNGYIFEEGNVNSLGSIMLDMLDNQAHAKQMGINSRKIVDCSINEYTFKDVFERVLLAVSK